MIHASPNPPASTNFPATSATIHSGEPGAKLTVGNEGGEALPASCRAHEQSDHPATITPVTELHHVPAD